MNSMVQWWPEAGTARLIVDTAWQTTLIAGCAWLAIRFVLTNPASKAWGAILGLGACVAVPWMAAAVRATASPVVVFRYSAEREVESVATEAPTDVSPEAPTEAPTAAVELLPSDVVLNSLGEEGRGSDAAARPLMENEASFASASAGEGQDRSMEGQSGSWDGWEVLLWGWIGGSTLLLIRLAARWGALRRLIARSSPCQDEALREAFRAACEKQGIRRRVSLHVSSEIVAPAIAAFWRPVVLIPAQGGPREEGTDGTLQTKNWDPVMLHELAHLRRGDGWWGLWAELAVVVLPWQPLVWALKRAYSCAADEACDDWTIAAGVNPLLLANELMGWAAAAGRTPTLASPMASHAGARVERLLTVATPIGPQALHPRRWPGLAAAGMAVGLLACIAPVGAEPEAPAAAPDGETAKNEDPSKDSDSSKTGSSADGKAVVEGSTKPAEGSAKTAEGGGQEADRYPSPDKPYLIEPPDVLRIEAIRLDPRWARKIEKWDSIRLNVTGTPPDSPISGNFEVDGEGQLALGPLYGSARVAGMTVEQATAEVEKTLRETLRDPKVQIFLARREPDNKLEGEYSVGPDGRINLGGTHGTVYVAGKSIPEARKAVEKQLAEEYDQPAIRLDVKAYNSKVFYVITLSYTGSDSIVRFPVTGNDRVLDAIALVQAVITPGSKIWVSRLDEKGKSRTIPVDWDQLKKGSDAEENFRLHAGDRVFMELKLSPGEKYRMYNAPKK